MRSLHNAILLGMLAASADGFCTGPLPLRAAGGHSTAMSTRISPVCMTVVAEARDLSLSRRGVMGGLFTTLVVAAGSPVSAKKTSATAEDTIKAYKVLLQVQDELDRADELAAAKDWAGILTLLDQPEFKGVEATLLTLVSGPVLSAEDKKTIGTRKRYGTAADVLFGIAAIASIDDPQLQACSSGQCSGDFVSADVEVPKALKGLKAALKEITGTCKFYKEFK